MDYNLCLNMQFGTDHKIEFRLTWPQFAGGKIDCIDLTIIGRLWLLMEEVTTTTFLPSFFHIVSQNKLINESAENDPVFFVNKLFCILFHK